LFAGDLYITLLGDIAFTGILSSEPYKNICRFKEITNILTRSDFVIANFEAPVKTNENRNDYKKFIHYCLKESAEDLCKMLNIGCVSLANNHIYDCKIEGLKATINMLDDLGILHTGAGWLRLHTEPVLMELRGTKIAFLAYVDRTTNPKTENYKELYINYFEPKTVIEVIKNLKGQVDIIICSIHWGVDYSFYPTPEQVKIARGLIDSGADFIMGHHPHTIQPFEKYNSGYIFYSLGGLTFGDYIKEGKKQKQALFRKTKKGLIARYYTFSNDFQFISTLEKKGNYVETINRNYQKWTKRKWFEWRLKNSSKITVTLFNFKEKIIDRVYEYFFGYYKNPFVRLFQFSNIKKIGRLFR